MGSEECWREAVVDRRRRSSGPCHKLNLGCGEERGEGEEKGERKERGGGRGRRERGGKREKKQRDKVGGGGRGGEKGRKMGNGENGMKLLFCLCITGYILVFIVEAELELVN